MMLFYSDVGAWIIVVSLIVVMVWTTVKAEIIVSEMEFE